MQLQWICIMKNCMSLSSIEVQCNQIQLNRKGKAIGPRWIPMVAPWVDLHWESEQLHRPAPPWRPRPQPGRGRRRRPKNWWQYPQVGCHNAWHMPLERVHTKCSAHPSSVLLKRCIFGCTPSLGRDAEREEGARNELTIEVAMVLMQPTVTPPLACQWQWLCKAGGIDLHAHKLLNQVLQDHDGHAASLPLGFLLSFQLSSIRRGSRGKQ